MSATNTTPNYNLSQFIGTDKPAWLQDYNGDMLRIDSGINAAKNAADSANNAASAAQNDATTALGDIATINGQISTINSTLGSAVGNINTINALIGNGTPTTSDHTIIGAINELDAELTVSASTMTPDDPNVVYNVNLIKKYGNIITVEIRANSYAASAYTAVTIGTLPTGYIPSNQVFLPANGLDSNGYPAGAAIVTIATDGTIQLVTGGDAISGFLITGSIIL